MIGKIFPSLSLALAVTSEMLLIAFFGIPCFFFFFFFFFYDGFLVPELWCHDCVVASFGNCGRRWMLLGGLRSCSLPETQTAFPSGVSVSMRRSLKLNQRSL